jgi:hypothetical protein
MIPIERRGGWREGIIGGLVASHLMEILIWGFVDG